MKNAMKPFLRLLRPDKFPQTVALLLAITLLLLALNPVLAHFFH